MKVDFFIIGAPKSGTTSLSEYLSTHPDICMAFPKEPSYFCDDFPGIRLVSTEQDYESLFSRCDRDSCHGDASTAYMISGSAIANINQYNPQAKIIIILRNPVEMLPSWHSQMVYSLFENETDFQAAYALQGARRRGECIPETCRESNYLIYSDIVRYDNQVERVLQICGKERVKIILYEDFIKDTRSVYLEVLDFLGLPDDGRENFHAANTSKAARFGFINKILHNPPKWLWFLLEKSKHTALRNIFFHGHRLLKKFNTTSSTRAPVDQDFIRQLKSEFQPSIRRLSILIGRDLSHWD